MKYILSFLLCCSALAQQTVNNFAVKTNLTVAGTRPTLMVSNVSQMRSLTAVQDAQIIQTSGRTVSGVGGGTYQWDSSSTTVTNLGTCFNLSIGGTGRFKYVGESPGDIRLWGAIPDSIVPGGTNVDVNIQAAINTLTASTFGGSSKPQIFIPNGYWYVGNTLLVTNPVSIVGEGIEINSVNVTDYPLNGAVIGSNVGGGNPVIKIVGTDVGGNTYIQGVDLQGFGIDGNGAEGPGILWDCNSNMSGCTTSKILVRRVGGSAFKGGDTTQSGSPRYGYCTFEDLTAILPGIDGFEFYCEQLATVKMRWVGLYCNGAGRNGFNYVNMGDFYAERWVENNSAQNQNGDGLHLQNINGATFLNCYWEGDGRNQASGGSYTPAYSAAAARLEGVSKCSFIDCTLTSPSGDLASPTNSGVIELVSSLAASGFLARDTGNNEFLNCRFAAYTPTTSIPSATAVGSGGSLSAGVYRYRVSITYSGGWEIPLTACGERVLTSVSNDSVNISGIQIGSTLGTNTVTGRKIYRTAANGSTFKLLTTIADNVTTTYTDTTADASLGVDASFFWIIYADSNSFLNRFNKLNVDVQPLSLDAGQRNTFFTINVANTSPATMPNIGMGSFNNTFSSGFGGIKNFFGADSSGMLTGYGITAGTPHQTSFLLPSFQSSRYAQNQMLMINGEVNSTANTISIGGGTSDLASTEVALYAGSTISTSTGTKQVSVTSGGTAFQTAVTNLSTFGVGGSSQFGNTVAFADNVSMANNKFYQIKDSGGVSRNLIGKNSSDIVSVGSGSGAERINITAGTGGLFLGQPGVTASIVVPRINTATAVNTTRNSQSFLYTSSYWNGLSEVQVDAITRLSMDSTAPAYSLYWNVNGDKMQLKSDGTLRVLTGPIQLVTIQMITGAGSPEGVVTATTGSLYMNTSGGVSTTLYVKESGAGNTGWVGK
jgi:hypothetical protein